MMRYGLVGKTLAHSYSKEIHESLGRYEYDLFSLSSDEMTDLVRSGDFDGLNITIPYKKDVIPLCDEVSDLARAIGAVNTLYWKDAGCSERGASSSVTIPTMKVFCTRQSAPTSPLRGRTCSCSAAAAHP